MLVFSINFIYLMHEDLITIFSNYDLLFNTLKSASLNCHLTLKVIILILLNFYFFILMFYILNSYLQNF